MSKGDKSISEWTDIFKELYLDVDYHRQPEQMWTAVMAHTSKIGESIRKVAFDELLEGASHTFCWLCSFIIKCNELEDDVFSIKESFCGIVSLKYPGVCGHCLRDRCQCDHMTLEEQKDKAAKYEELNKLRNFILPSIEKCSIKDYRDIFLRIYGGMNHLQSLENIGFHFLEEIGEAAFCVRRLSQLRNIPIDKDTGIELDFIREISTINGMVDNYIKYKDLIKNVNYTLKEPNMLKARVLEAKLGLVIEIGDSFSWFCSILNKLDIISKSIFEKPEDHPDFMKPLEYLLNFEYIEDGEPKCPTCKENPCICVFYNLEISK